VAYFSNTADVLLLRRDNLVTFMQRMRNISFTGVLDSTMPHPSVIAILLSTTVLSNASLLNAPDSYKTTYATSQQALYAALCLTIQFRVESILRRPQLIWMLFSARQPRFTFQPRYVLEGVKLSFAFTVDFASHGAIYQVAGNSLSPPFGRVLRMLRRGSERNT